jgi:hypothetical protein
MQSQLRPGDHFAELLDRANPPGNATNASASAAMAAFRSCIDPTTRRSDSPACATSRAASACGITPVT